MHSTRLFCRLNGVAQNRLFSARLRPSTLFSARVECFRSGVNSFCCAADLNEQDLIDKDFQLRSITKDDVAISFSRSSGPGGQNVNKVNTKVDMRLNLQKSSWIPRPVVDAVFRLEKNKINKDGELVVTSTKSRTQMANIDDAIDKIQQILDSAVESVRPREIDPAKKKKLEKQKKKANEVRIQQKRQQSMRKKDRKVSRKDW